MKQNLFFVLIALGILISSCSSNDPASSDLSNLYVPAASDTTATASIDDLTQGRDLYINNCNACHQLYAPDRYSVSDWKGIIKQMSPKTNMTSNEVELVTKYLCKGNN